MTGDHEPHYGVGPHDCFWRAGLQIGQSSYLGPEVGFLPDPEDAARRDPPAVGVADSGSIPCGMWYCVCPECRDQRPALVEAWRDNMRREGASDERIAAWVLP